MRDCAPRAMDSQASPPLSGRRRTRLIVQPRRPLFGGLASTAHCPVSRAARSRAAYKRALLAASSAFGAYATFRRSGSVITAEV